MCDISREEFEVGIRLLEDRIKESEVKLKLSNDRLLEWHKFCLHWSTYIDTNNEHGIPVKRCDLCGRVVE